MGSTYDIFKVTPDGPLWVEAVRGLREANERIARLALTFPANTSFARRETSWPNWSQNGPRSPDEHSRTHCN